MHIRHLMMMTLLAGTCLLDGTQFTTDAHAAPAEPNKLAPAERKAGWRLLFDGKTTKGWRGYNRPDMPRGWQVIAGALVRVEGGVGGQGAGGGDDIITTEQYGDFELSIEWRTIPGGNSGVLYRAVEGAKASWHVAPEMQVLDNTKDPVRSTKQLAGSLYDLYEVGRDVAFGPGEWNEARVIARGAHVEHWLNGKKVVEYQLDSDDWKQHLAGSKFKHRSDFAKARKGHICLQDHSNRVEYRNVKIRRFK